MANALADGDAYEIGDAVGGNVVPDPNGSTARDIATAGPAIVHDGALTRSGLLACSPWIDAAPIEPIRRFVSRGGRARKPD